MKAFPFCFVLCCLLFHAMGLFAQTGASDGTLTTNPVFQQNCAKCHGKNAEGRHFGGPALVSEKTNAASVDELRNVIANGRHRMPKYEGKLTTDEISTLAEQIKSLNKK